MNGLCLKKVIALPLLALLLQSVSARTSEPEIEVQNERETYLSESIQYNVIIKNVDAPPAPDLSAHEADFTVTAAGNRSLNQRSVFSINGRRSVQESLSHVYIYKLTPRRAGVLTIPAPTVNIGGKTLAGETKQVNVIGPEKQDTVLLEVVPSRPRVYPTQSFNITLRILVKPLQRNDTKDPVAALRDPPTIRINWVEQVPDGLESADFNQWLNKLLVDTGRGFKINDMTLPDDFPMFNERRYAVFSLYTGREKRKASDGTEINYFVYELKRTYTAQKKGVYTFGPASVRGTFIDGAAQRRVFAIADEAKVEVRGVPNPRPETFSGGIGAHQVVASAAPQALRVGDPVTLILEVKRLANAGSLDLVSAPDLSTIPSIADDFEIIDKAPVGQTSGDVKRFSYGLRPKRPGVNIPALSVTFFDPETEKYTEQTTQPIALTVTKAAERTADTAPLLPAGTSHEIRNREQGIFQNIDDLAMIRDERVNPAAYIAVAGTAWAAFAALYVVIGRMRRRAGDSAWVRRQNAWREASVWLDNARRGSGPDVVKALRSSVLGFIADMQNLPAAGMTAGDAGRAVAAAKVSGEVAAQTSDVLQTLEAAEYGSSAGADAAMLIARVEKLLPELRRELEARR
jgi:hypothetical protein